MISYPLSDGSIHVATVTEPKVVSASQSTTPLPMSSPGHIFTSIRHGLGNGLTKPNLGTQSVLEDIRAAMRYVSENDIKLGSNLMEVTFDPDFCEYIGGYPKGAALWFKHGDAYDLVVSLIEDNKFNFIEHPEYIDNIHWRWAVKQRTTSSGYPMIASNACTRPFGDSITIGKSNGSSIISDLYVPDRDQMIFCTGSIVFTYDDSVDVPTTQSPSMFNGRLNGSVPFCGLQVFLCVSNRTPDEGSGASADLARGHSPNICNYIFNLPNIRLHAADDLTSGIGFRDGMFNIFNGSRIVTTEYVENAPAFKKSEICYYPIFSNSMRRKCVMVPVRKGQYVFLGMSTQERYAISNLSIDVRAYDYANFDGSVHK